VAAPHTERDWITAAHGKTVREIELIFPRSGGHVDYAANAAVCARNSNSMGLR